MLTAIDSFVTYLSDTLGSPLVLPVVYLRLSADQPQALRMQVNALNIRVLDTERKGSMQMVMVSLDIVATDERQAWTWAAAIEAALESLMIPESDYVTSPDTPRPLGQQVSWDADTLGFRMVGSDDHFAHLNATFDIRHARFA